MLERWLLLEMEASLPSSLSIVPNSLGANMCGFCEVARVVVVDINEKGGKETVALVEKQGGGGAAIFVRGDVTSKADVSKRAFRSCFSTEEAE